MITPQMKKWDYNQKIHLLRKLDMPNRCLKWKLSHLIHHTAFSRKGSWKTRLPREGGRNLFEFTWHAGLLVGLAAIQGIILPCFTYFEGQSLLLATWDTLFGECWWSENFLLPSHIGFHWWKIPSIKHLVPYTNMTGCWLNIWLFLARLANNRTLLTCPCTSSKINPFQCKLQFKLLFQ